MTVDAADGFRPADPRDGTMPDMPSAHVARTDRSTVRRKPERGHYDFETVHGILDEALICHVGFALEGRSWVMPTAFVRLDGYVYLHGAAGNFALRTLASGAEACLTVTLIDGVVLARSAFNHSINYRSVMMFGRAEPVADDEEKERALLALLDHMVPGRSTATRLPTAQELRATLVVRFPIQEGSAKVRTGGPIDEATDHGLPYWAGVIPLTLVRGEPQPAGSPSSDTSTQVEHCQPSSGGGFIQGALAAAENHGRRGTATAAGVDASTGMPGSVCGGLRRSLREHGLSRRREPS